MAEAIAARFATSDDLAFVQQDGYVPSDAIHRKIQCQEVIVAERDGGLVGYLRLEFLWSLVPYIALIFVVPQNRRKGVGTALLGFAETYLRSQGHEALYSSSQANEPEPQAWHRHMGFLECGFIAGLNTGGIGEVFFRKRLG